MDVHVSDSKQRERIDENEGGGEKKGTNSISERGKKKKTQRRILKTIDLSPADKGEKKGKNKRRPRLF